jgi:hypothetical protein
MDAIEATTLDFVKKTFYYETSSLAGENIVTGL